MDLTPHVLKEKNNGSLTNYNIRFIRNNEQWTTACHSFLSFLDLVGKKQHDDGQERVKR